MTIAPVDASSDAFLVLAVMVSKTPVKEREGWIVPPGPSEPASELALTLQPFTPDYFQVHASTCSIIRDVYKKLLSMILPLTRGTRNADPTYGTLMHPSAFINMSQNDGSGHDVATDAAIFGEMPKNVSLVGDGQKLTQAVIDLFLKVDSRLKVSLAGSKWWEEER